MRRMRYFFALFPFLAVTTLAGQVRITPPANRYTPVQDVELGRQAAAQVEQQFPVMRDEEVTSYVESVGRRLVAAIPPDLQHPPRICNTQSFNTRSRPSMSGRLMR